MAMRRLFGWMALVGFLLAFFFGCTASQSKFCTKCQEFVPLDHEQYMKKEGEAEGPQALLLPAEALEENSLARMSG